MERFFSVTAIIVIVVSVTAATALVMRTALATPSLYVDPSAFEDPSVSPGDTIAVRINTTAVDNMKVWEFNLTFSPDVLSIKSITKAKVQDMFPQSSIVQDDAAGYAWISSTYPTPVTISTDTSLVEIVFNVKGYGSTILHFDSSGLQDGGGGSIAHDTVDGFVHIIRRNIGIQGIDVLYTETYTGRVIPVNVTVFNDGEIAESFTVNLYYDTTFIGFQDVVDLPSMQTLNLTFNWSTAGVPPSATLYTISANATVLPNEIKTLDNTLVDGGVKLKIIGDVNGDGIVDINDIDLWNAAFDSHPGSGNWNPQADINYDGVVDVTDGNLILEHWHEHL